MSGFAGELLDFLLPKFDDPLQVSFLLIILLMIGGTMATAHRSARPASWEKKWNRGTPDHDDDDLDIEHGSVTDLWHAVATAPEKLAEIMPGMLLVIGLLGTFLGLGMALDHASSILGQSNAVADSMGDLLGLLKGLGTKFKTSTWGIMGFVLLKIWSEATRFDEKRLIWVIDKVKTELDRRSREKIAAEDRKQKELFEQISRASVRIVGGISDAVTKANLQLLQNLDSLRSALGEGFKGVGENLQSSHTEMESLVLSSAGMLHEALIGVKEAQETSNEVLASFSDGTQRIIQQMADAAQGMASGASKVSSAAQSLETVVKDFGGEFKQVLDDVRTDLSSAINTMTSLSTGAMKEGSAKMESATREISDALQNLSTNVGSTMGKVEISIKDSLKLQTDSSVLFTSTAETLGINVETSTRKTEEVLKTIQESLKSVSDASQNTNRIGKSLEKQVPILERIASYRDANSWPEILEEIRALRIALTSSAQQSPSRSLTITEGNAP